MSTHLSLLFQGTLHNRLVSHTSSEAIEYTGDQQCALGSRRLRRQGWRKPHWAVNRIARVPSYPLTHPSPTVSGLHNPFLTDDMPICTSVLHFPACVLSLLPGLRVMSQLLHPQHVVLVVVFVIIVVIVVVILIIPILRPRARALSLASSSP